MKTIKEIKDEIARKNGYSDFNAVILKRDEVYLINECMQAAAVEVLNAVAETVVAYDDFDNLVEVDKQSILDIIKDLK